MAQFFEKGRELLTFGYFRLFANVLIPDAVIVLCSQFLSLIHLISFSNIYKDDEITLYN